MADKIRIVLEGLRGEDSIAELCRRDQKPLSKNFLEADSEGSYSENPCGLSMKIYCGRR